MTVLHIRGNARANNMSHMKLVKPIAARSGMQHFQNIYTNIASFHNIECKSSSVKLPFSMLLLKLFGFSESNESERNYKCSVQQVDPGYQSTQFKSTKLCCVNCFQTTLKLHVCERSLNLYCVMLHITRAFLLPSQYDTFESRCIACIVYYFLGREA